MFKKSVYIFIILLCFVSCTSKEKESMTVNIVDSVTLYNGVERRYFEICDGKEGEIKVSLLKESGTFGLKVSSLDNPSYIPYIGSDCPEYFVVNLKESGEYEAIITAENYKGTFMLEFSEK